MTTHPAFTIATRYRKADDALAQIEGCADSLRVALELCEAYDLDIHVPELPNLTTVLSALDGCRARGDIGPAPTEPALEGLLTPRPADADTGNTRGVLDDPEGVWSTWANTDFSFQRHHRYGVLDYGSVPAPV